MPTNRCACANLYGRRTRIAAMCSDHDERPSSYHCMKVWLTIVAGEVPGAPGGEATKARRPGWLPRRCLGRRRPPPSTFIPGKFKDENARVASGGPLKDFRMAERVHRIAITSDPTVFHGPARELVVFGRAFGTLSADRRGSLSGALIVWPPTSSTSRPRPA